MYSSNSTAPMNSSIVLWLLHGTISINEKGIERSIVRMSKWKNIIMIKDNFINRTIEYF